MEVTTVGTGSFLLRWETSLNPTLPDFHWFHPGWLPGQAVAW